MPISKTKDVIISLLLVLRDLGALNQQDVVDISTSLEQRMKSPTKFIKDEIQKPGKIYTGHEDIKTAFTGVNLQ